MVSSCKYLALAILSISFEVFWGHGKIRDERSTMNKNHVVVVVVVLLSAIEVIGTVII